MSSGFATGKALVVDFRANRDISFVFVKNLPQLTMPANPYGYRKNSEADIRRFRPRQRQHMPSFERVIIN
jgi:hypothetical protein